ncbi:hypothetical protein B0J13DRAFT_547140 [Dactylonectria estremocensis]|uniref:Uncharacterized protein n=1 Tax=Dactylonectria estremocensis TaxID=1079267 RepID=A0A9P9JCB7_9HYPO|nr:hypothetical protein B0J13DRAFT_547140 [Dactylonectria estremocensis]
MPSKDRPWIARDGPYQDLTNGLCMSDPRLSQPDVKLLELGISWENRDVKIRAIEFGKAQDDQILLSPISGPDALARCLARERPDGKARRTAYIFEGMNRDVATVLGDHFQMHPSMFIIYERTANAASRSEGSYSMLATSLATQTYLCMSYRELVTLPSELLGYFSFRCSATGRDVSITRVNGKFDPVAMVRRKCIVWNRTRQDGWDCIVICDPPLRNVTVTDKGPTRGCSFPACAKPTRGYVDFLPADIQAKTLQGPPRTSMADDMCFYLATHSTLPGLTWETPEIVAIFAKKIIASLYARHFDHLRTTVIRSQLPMRRQSDFMGLELAAVESNWSDCQTLEKRLSKCCLDLEELLIQLQLPLERPNPGQITSWREVGADFQMLYHQFNYARNWTEKINSSITGLAGIAGNRQAFREQQLSLQAADRARNITTIGLVFVPLAYVATLFSMSEEYAPGGEKFWLYFAISIPTTLFVLVAYQCANWIGKRYERGIWIPFMARLNRMT